MALLLSALSLLALAFITWLTVDGLLAIRRRRRAEQVRRPRRMRVAARSEVAGDLLCLTLVDPDGRPLPAFAAGQHLLLSAPAGRQGKTIQRAYSLAAWQRTPTAYELGIKREPQGAMTQWLWPNLKLGTLVDASLPQGDFVLDGGAEPLVLIGGGIGITPMRAMLHAALAADRPVHLFHLARSAGSLLYREEFVALAAAHPDFRYHPQLSQPDGEWAGARGRIDAAQIVAALAEASRCQFYLCAGNAVMDALADGLAALGVDHGRIHREAFGAANGTGASGLNVTVDGPGGQKTMITAGEPTLLAALEANGVELPSECRAGSCGQCVARLTSGEVDWLLTPEHAVDEGHILPCVCSPRSDLALIVP